MDAGVAAIIAAAIAVVGGLVGGLLSTRATKNSLDHAERLERARMEREDVRRHEEIRRDVYPHFLATSDEGVLVAMDFLERGVYDGIDFEPTLASTNWYQRQRGMLDAIELVGSERTIDAARAFDRAVHRLLAPARRIRDEASAAAQERRAAEAAGLEQTARVASDGEASSDAEALDEEGAFDGAELGDEMLVGELDGEPRGSLRNLIEFMKPLPYPLGADPDPADLYGGNVGIQMALARSELRVRRHDYLNAARTDLGLPDTPYPSDQVHTSASQTGGGEEALAQ